MWKNIKGKDLMYKKDKHVYNFKQFETIKSFGESVYTGKTKIDEAEIGQRNLLESMVHLIIKLDQKQKGKEKNFWWYKSSLRRSRTNS